MVVETDSDFSWEKLGGVVKVGEELSPDLKLSSIITGDFGVSDYSGEVDLFKFCKDLKKETGKRFVLPRDSRVLSSVVVKKQKLIEIIFTKAGVFKTVWVQDFEDWGRRDYGRPQVEAHIGMLPPKVARMMLNIAVSGKQLAVSTVLDPFCGVGTILMEGCELGFKMVGSDIDSRQVARAKANLDSFGLKAEIMVADARRIQEGAEVIVTEADLGPNNGIRIGQSGISRRLQDLYLECFRNWKKFVKRIVIALPNTSIVDKAIDMGYILESGPFIYARPQAKVKRFILVFNNVTR
jgi:tRNA G10  N-methylase Trm11